MVPGAQLCCLAVTGHQGAALPHVKFSRPVRGLWFSKIPGWFHSELELSTWGLQTRVTVGLFWTRGPLQPNVPWSGFTSCRITLSLTACKIPESLQKSGDPNNFSHEELKSRQE